MRNSWRHMAPHGCRAPSRSALAITLRERWRLIRLGSALAALKFDLGPPLGGPTALEFGPPWLQRSRPSLRAPAELKRAAWGPEISSAARSGQWCARNIANIMMRALEAPVAE